MIESIPGMGPILGAESIAADGDLNGYANAGRLARLRGKAEAPRSQCYKGSRGFQDGGDGGN
ncbi:transposase [Microbacterium deminutum]